MIETSVRLNETPHRLLRKIFLVSDVLGGIVGSVGLVGAMTFPFVAPIHAKMAGLPMSSGRIALTVLACLGVALGAYLLSRRRVAGLLFFLLPSVMWWLDGSPMLALWYAVGAIGIHGSPLAFAYAEMKVNAYRAART